MIKRLISLLFLAWVLGFAWFALLLPQPAPAEKTDSGIQSAGTSIVALAPAASVRLMASTRLPAAGRTAS